MIRQLIVAATLSAASSSAYAQVAVSSTSGGAAGDLSVASFDPDSAVSPISIVQGAGVKVGEGTVLHPVVGIETGFVSNVFYTKNDPQAAGLLRLSAQIGTASLNKQRLNSTDVPPNPEDTNAENSADHGLLQYETSVRLAYDQTLSSNGTITDTSGLGIGALFHGLVYPDGTVSFGIDENYERLIRAANFETSTNDNRDLNILRLTLHYQPVGRSVSGYLYYQNTLDVFEESQNTYPNRMDHRVGLHPVWRFLPETSLYADASLGVITEVGTAMTAVTKSTSYPLVTHLGLATLLSLKTTANIQVGYTNGFYSAGPSYSAPTFDVALAYRYSPLGRVGVSYDLTYADSVNASFYRDHTFRAFVQQGFAPFVVVVAPELHFREYQGALPSLTGSTTRDDTLVAIVAGIHYNFRNWIAATVDYRLSLLSTDYRYTDQAGTTDDPSFVRHELLFGLRVAM